MSLEVIQTLFHAGLGNVFFPGSNINNISGLDYNQIACLEECRSFSSNGIGIIISGSDDNSFAQHASNVIGVPILSIKHDASCGIKQSTLSFLMKKNAEIKISIIRSDFNEQNCIDWLKVVNKISNNDSHKFIIGPISSFIADSIISEFDEILSVMIGHNFVHMRNNLAILPCGRSYSRNGKIYPISFTSIDTDIGTTHDKESFIKISSQGISCQIKLGAGAKYTNPLPENYNSIDEFSQDVSFGSWGHQECGESEGRFIAYLRNVRMNGRMGYLYTSSNALINETFAVSSKAVKTLQSGMAEYENSVGYIKYTNDGIESLQLSCLFSDQVEITTPVVIPNYNDLWCYNHFVEGCLSRFWYRDDFPELCNLPILMNVLNRGFQYQYLDLLGLKNQKFVFFHPSTSLLLEKSYYISLADRPHHTAGNLTWLRNNLLKYAGNVPEGLEGGLYYISRGDANGRRAVNEDQVLALLEPLGFQRLEWSKFTVKEQISIAHHAKVIVGPHGSSLSNIVFVSKGCCVVDLYMPTSSMTQSQLSGADWGIAFAVQKYGGRYFAVIGEDAEVGHRGQADYYININKLESVLKMIYRK